eukprot:4272961-Pleurochrysis_carterae.AAC.3
MHLRAAACTPQSDQRFLPRKNPQITNDIITRFKNTATAVAAAKGFASDGRGIGFGFESGIATRIGLVMGLANKVKGKEKASMVSQLGYVRTKNSVWVWECNTAGGRMSRME